MFGAEMNSTKVSTERFVSIQGFFAFEYPQTWKSEIDEAGHYIFFNENGGSGVIRVMMLPNEFSGADAIEKMQNEILNQNKAFGATRVDDTKVAVVSFTKEHDVNGSLYTVTYYAIPTHDKTILITYTIQSMMKVMQTVMEEQSSLINLVKSFEFLS
jgi:hypothetical protein